MQAYYSDHYVLPLPEGHRFPMAKYRLLRECLARELPQVRLAEAPPASDGELALAHSPAYVEAIACGRVSTEMMREIGFPWSPAMVERSRRSAGATVAAARVALRQGVAANLAGGTHHASADRGGGFCVFNDVAVAARLMQAEWLRPHARHFVSSLALQAAEPPESAPLRAVPPCAGRPGAAALSPEGAVGCLGAARRQPAPPRLPLQVAVIDLDVHQGNGTARIFARDPSVFTLSLHGEKNFPFRKEASDLDVALPDGCCDDAYLQALDGALDELGRRFEPGLVFYLAGADPHQGDRLGRLKLSDDGLEARDRRVFDWAWQRRIPLVLTMAGGYGVDIATTVQVQCNTYRVALAYWQRWQALTA